MSHLSNLHYAYGIPESQAVLRQSHGDFRVVENLSFEPDGNGQHVYLHIQKSGLNTNDVAQSLAKFAGVKSLAVGYAGLKDKHAVTTQWFSVDLAGKDEPDWSRLQSDALKLVDVSRHSRKLKRGAISRNNFELVLRQFAGDRTELESRLDNIKKSGVPNYFGEQRFGRNDFNLVKAEQLLGGNKKIKRHLRSIYLSAVRAFLFNQLLSKRVAQHNWNSAMSGDVFMLEGSRSVFAEEQVTKDIIVRLASGDIHLTGPLWGNGDLPTKADAFALEKQLAVDYSQRCSLLENAGLKQDRRALRCLVHDLFWDWVDDGIVVRFELPAGSYATVVLRELVLSA